MEEKGKKMSKEEIDEFIKDYKGRVAGGAIIGMAIGVMVGILLILILAVKHFLL